ncbi:aminotransferase class I/II-fold pyridoxal phosphate-dependent enzyme [Natronococcus occultus]|uniref:8-amino-7-oxononanoate synthase n=1 Tax=Natronococcus occultus SP4 TaxID=694430 RepID=L0K4C0_9EURY|nr:8-amino-7-oxononanoate synthase [Natronococcus occultus]AGB39856.1 7-keto-8-aminopelargonate synthetase-like enzyme [Natronococcus occultus SP4]
MQRHHSLGFDLETRLRERERSGLRRDLVPIDSVDARARTAADPKGEPANFGAERLIFASNDYLGLAGDPRVAETAVRAARDVGTGAGASRLVVGDTSTHRSLERRLATEKNAERALTFSSGYAANVGTITALAPDVIFSDALNHASIIDGARLSDATVEVYDHCDADALAQRMAERFSDGVTDESWLVVTDSVFSMDGDVAPIEALCDVAEEYGAWVMVDEAHATGVYDGGIVNERGLENRVQVQLGTLSKALGAQGGFVAGDETLIEYLLNAARSFVFSTGLAPPAAAASERALALAPDRRDALWTNVERLRTGLEALGYEVLGDTHILPVLVGNRDEAVALADRITEAGIVAPAIRPPTVPEGTSRIRLTPKATHTDTHIEQCLTAFETAMTKGGCP